MRYRASALRLRACDRATTHTDIHDSAPTGCELPAVSFFSLRTRPD